MLRSQFFRKFAKPEFYFIAGKRFGNLIFLSIILSLSMIAIGLGEGAIKYLDKKMNNPFVSFVNVSIPHQNPYNLDKLEKIHQRVNDSLNKDDLSLGAFYGFSNPYAVYDNYANFTNRESNVTKTAKVRRAKKDDPIYSFILKSDTIAKKNNFQYDGWGCVVSKDFLNKDKSKLLYSKTTDFSYLQYRRNINGKDVFISIPVHGIVESLPDGVCLIAGHKLFDSFYDSNSYHDLAEADSIVPHNGYKQYYVVKNKVFENYLLENNFQEVENDYIIYNQGKMYRCEMSYSQKLSFEKNIPSNINVFEVLDFNSVNLPKENDITKERFVFEFAKDRFSSISIFNEFLKNYTVHDGKSLQIDMRVIESKKNFDLFNKLAELLSMSLIFFSIFSLVLFITNLIVSHISKNKKNLGTLKAFGLSNNNIIMIYSSISLVLILFSFIFSLVFSQLVGSQLIEIIAIKFNIGDASELKYVRYPIIKLLMFFIVLPSLAIYLKLSREINGNTPGDLIYGRD